MTCGYKHAIASLGALLLLLASPVEAREVTRDGYVERVEEICKRASLANRSIFQGVERMVRNGQLRRAAPRLARGARALDRAIGRIRAVPPPAADRARLARWVRQGRAGSTLLARIGRILRQERRGPLEDMADELLFRVKRANATVVGFELDYCRLKPDRFL